MSAYTPNITAAEPTREDRAKLLATQLRATLSLAASLTDEPTLLEHIRATGALINRPERFADIGMLGRNGIGPQVDSILVSARMGRVSLAPVRVSADRLSVSA